MPKNDIGGFFVSLGLGIDKASFETGNKLIDGVTTNLNKLIGTARNAAVVLTGTAVATGVVESTAYKTATAIGISTEALDLWKASAKIAGVDANGLVGAMSRMSEVMNHMTIDGSGLEAYTKQLGELDLIADDIDIEKLLNLKPDELMKEIITKAQEAVAGGESLTHVSMIVKDILGESGQGFFIELERQGKTIEEFLAGAQKTIFTTAADNEKGNNFRVESNTLKTELESITKLVGDSVGGVLTQPLNDINSWIQDNGKAIKDAVENIAGLVEKIVGSDAFKDTGNIISATIKLIGGDKQGALQDLKKTSVAQEIYSVRDINQMLQDYAKANGIKYYSELKFDEIPEYIQEAILSYYTNGGYKTWSPIDAKSLKKAREERGINDGIIRPDGTVTQVAPDDWVFAVRDVGDLAQAFTPKNNIAPDTMSMIASTVGDMARNFIPQSSNSISAPSEYSIVQNFTINSGNDMPQVIRQQAYRGTQDGLLEVMNESSHRLQLMSGTR